MCASRNISRNISLWFFIVCKSWLVYSKIISHGMMLSDSRLKDAKNTLELPLGNMAGKTTNRESVYELPHWELISIWMMVILQYKNGLSLNFSSVRYQVIYFLFISTRIVELWESCIYSWEMKGENFTHWEILWNGIEAECAHMHLVLSYLLVLLWKGVEAECAHMQQLRSVSRVVFYRNMGQHPGL